MCKGKCEKKCGKHAGAVEENRGDVVVCPAREAFLNKMNAAGQTTTQEPAAKAIDITFAGFKIAANEGLFNTPFAATNLYVAIKSQNNIQQNVCA